MSGENKGFEKVTDHVYKRGGSPNLYVLVKFTKLKIPRLLKSLKTHKVVIAKSRALQAIHEHLERYKDLRAEGKDADSGRRFAQVVDEMVMVESPKMRQATLDCYKLYYGELKKQWGHWDVNRITPDSWSHWLAQFRKNKTRKTYADFAKHMNKALRFAYQRKYATHMIKVESHDKKTQGPGRVFSDREISSLWENMNEETRDQFILCYECFMRLRESLHLSWDRVDLEQGIVTLRAEDVKTGSRTGKGRTIKMSPRAHERMRSRYNERIGSPFVFPSPTDITQPIEDNKTAWGAAKRRAGILGRARWHDLRHTALTRALLDRKIEPILVSEYAGVSIRTIERVYLHSTAEKTAVVANAIQVSVTTGHKRVTKRKKYAK